MNPLFSKALRAAKSARALEAEHDYDGACDRAYYAMFNAARTLLEENGALRPDEVKTHATVLRLFSEVFVLSGRAGAGLGRGLNLARGLRTKADYSRSAATRDEANKAIEAMEKLLQFAKECLEEGSAGR